MSDSSNGMYPGIITSVFTKDFHRDMDELRRLRTENSLLRSALAEVGRIHGRWITNEIDEYVAMDEISEQVTLAASKTPPHSTTTEGSGK